MDYPNLRWLSDWFKNISCKTNSPRILHGEFSQENIPALGPGDHNTLCYYFIYEYGQPLADHASVVGGVNNPSYFLIIRDVLEAIYDLRNKHRICHPNLTNNGNAIVVSTSGGKLGTGKGCGYSECYIHWFNDHWNNLVQIYHQYRLNEFLQFLEWLPFQHSMFSLENVLTHPTTGEQAVINVAYQDAINLNGLNQEDIQERLIMTFLRFGRNCATHIMNLDAAAIEDLLEQTWPGLLIVAYDIMVESITNPHNWDREV
ncbi:hypothetical protein RIF29_18634 [Crotalaria pallida]|uniref:Uncharacterized protein n=1 Tax=Crotalaria pallida TaxID=3830 RepID=A0AAN9F0I3_CROPI